MAWAQYTDPPTGLKQWVDVDKAAGWFGRLLELTSAAKLAQLDKADWPTQIAAVTEAWQALSWGFQALDLPSLAQPYYVLNSIGWLGRVTGTDASSGRRQTVNHLIMLPPVQPTNTFGQRIYAWWPTIGGQPFGPNNLLGAVTVRINLRGDSQVTTTCLSPLGVHDPACDFGDVSSGCSNGPGIQGCEQPRDVFGNAQLCAEPDCKHYNWNTLAWDNPPTVGIAAGPIIGVQKMSPPLRWSLEQLAEMAQRYANQSPLDTVAQALRWATASNIANAANAGILPPDLAQANAALTAQYNNVVASNRAGLAAFGAAVGALVGAVSVNPVAGGVVAGALAALAAVAPIAAGCDEDYFGRCKPVLELTSITGTATRPPSQVIPDAPLSTAAYFAAHPEILINAVSGIPLQTVSVPAPPPPPKTNTQPTATTPAPTSTSTVTTTEKVGLAIGGLTVVGLIGLVLKGKI